MNKEQLFASNQIKVLEEYIDHNNKGISNLLPTFSENYWEIQELVGFNSRCCKERNKLISKHFTSKMEYYQLKKLN
jgi:hypothetical protein